jgi:hypothetical protein
MKGDWVEGVIDNWLVDRVAAVLLIGLFALPFVLAALAIVEWMKWA